MPDALNPTDASTWPELLNPDEVAAVLRLTTGAVRRKLRDGTLPGRKIGGGQSVRTEWRTPKTDLLAYFQAPPADA